MRSPSSFAVTFKCSGGHACLLPCSNPKFNMLSQLARHRPWFSAMSKVPFKVSKKRSNLGVRHFDLNGVQCDYQTTRCNSTAASATPFGFQSAWTQPPHADALIPFVVEQTVSSSTSAPDSHHPKPKPPNPLKGSRRTIIRYFLALVERAYYLSQWQCKGDPMK